MNEFEGLEFKPFTQIGRPSLKTGADALARLSFEDSTIRRTAVAQGAILGACYLQTYRVLNSLSACPLVAVDVTVLGLVGGAPAQGWGGDTARRRW